ncbi:hypothetical protein SGLAM104S_04868 [Streptomyces glaucescens]
MLKRQTATGARSSRRTGVHGRMFTVSTWYGKGRTPETTALAATLSLWTDLRPAFDAVYTGPPP